MLVALVFVDCFLAEKAWKEGRFGPVHHARALGLVALGWIVTAIGAAAVTGVIRTD